MVQTGLAGLLSAQYPVQHPADVALHVWPVLRHEVGGTSQKHAVPAQGTSCWLSSTAKHWSPLQQFALDAQDWAAPEQAGGGGPQTPELQTSVALQQGREAQDPAVFAQVGGGSVIGGAVQVPPVAPGRTVQGFGEQQSPFTVQLPPVGWHAVAVCVLQTPASQKDEQQSAAASHVAPFGAHPPQTVPS